MFKQSTMAFTALLMLVIFITLPASSAHPISRREYGTASAVSVPFISDIQGSAATPTPTPTPATTTIILPRDHESLPSDIASNTRDKETENPSETSSSSSPEETNSEEEEGDDGHSGLHPNAIAGIAVGAGFGILLLIAAFMYAFRVGWEKGQHQKEKEKEKEMAETKLQRPPAPPAATAPQRSWQLVDECITSRPPSVLIVNTAGSSCWDSGSWDCCDEHAENHRILGERYSFRPGQGVYEITDPGANKPHDAVRTDSGLGFESPAKAKGKEPERPDSPSVNV
ncbi:hypothetical protein DFP73DRAFT_53179 [Morchella snyderi]|nr:hypothetical protein DFP73DRAFT_53179 [Morchella snyderi]